MIGKRLALAFAVIAAPLLATLAQPAYADGVPILITGGFSVSSSNSDFSLATGAFGGKLSNNAAALTGSLALSLGLGVAGETSGDLFSLTTGFRGSTVLTVTFSGLSDGSAMTSCTANNCVATSNRISFSDTSFTLIPGQFTVGFADGAVLAIVDGPRCKKNGNKCKRHRLLAVHPMGGNVIGENFTFELTQGPTAPVPEPASLALLGTALAGLGLVLRRRHRNAA